MRRHFLKGRKFVVLGLLNQNGMTTGCNIGSRTVLAKGGKLPLKFACPSGTSTCPATLLNKGELHCEDYGQNVACQAEQVRILFCLPDCRFLPNSLPTCNRASGYVARWTTHLINGSKLSNTRKSQFKPNIAPILAVFIAK